MTKKGQEIQEQILHYLDRNPDGLRIGVLQKLIGVSRNSIYRYLEELETRTLIEKQPDKLWKLKTPLKPKTIPGYQYQALFQGLKEVGGEDWSIETEEGRKKFRELGKIMFNSMKLPSIDVPALKQKTHHITEIMDYAVKLIEEAATVETYKLEPKMNKNGYPDKDTHLMAIITLEESYVSSDPVTGNGYAHYYIHAGIVEEFAQKVISGIYGGRCRCDVLKIDEANQSVDMALYLFFDSETPFLDPSTGQSYDFVKRLPPNYSDPQG